MKRIWNSTYFVIVLCLAELVSHAKTEGTQGLGLHCESDADCINAESNPQYPKYLYCNPHNHTCLCSVPSKEDVHECTDWKNEGQPCQNYFECDRKLGLSCIQGICKCDPDNTVRNDNEFYGVHRRVVAGECLLKVGFNCSDDRNDPRRYAGMFCIHNARCDQARYANSGLCECKNDHPQTKAGLCGLRHGQECSATNVCSDNLRCVSNSPTEKPKCQCPHSDYQEYDGSTRTCRSFLDCPCVSSDLNTCLYPGVCTQIGELYRCRCGPGMKMNDAGKCEIEYGFPCDYQDERGVVLCDQDAKLVCQSNIHHSLAAGFVCGCQNEGDVFESDRNSCNRPAGVRCKNDDRSMKCVTNAECDLKHGHLWGVCNCFTFYKPFANGTCGLDTEKMYG